VHRRNARSLAATVEQERLLRWIGLWLGRLWLISFGLVSLGLVSLGLIVFRPCRFRGAGGHPGIVFRRARARRHAFGLTTHPVRHVGNVLARGSAGAGRQRQAAEAEQG
jgi:hypothetical protein